MRWWVSLAFLGACHNAAPATPGRPAGSSCKVAEPVCDPAVTDDVAVALVRRRCAGCHADGGKAEHPLLDAMALGKERGDVAFRLAGCEMPPDDTPLPADERARLIGWGACAPAKTP